MAVVKSKLQQLCRRGGITAEGARAAHGPVVRSCEAMRADVSPVLHCKLCPRSRLFSFQGLFRRSGPTFLPLFFTAFFLCRFL